MAKSKSMPPREDERHKKILIICEGDEDTDYINRLKTCGVWDDEIIVTVKNAAGIDRIPQKYKKYWRLIDYDMVVVFCDTEEFPHKQFEDVKNAIMKFRKEGHGDKSVSWDDIIFYVNPCTMQVIIMHFGKETLKTKNKEDYSDIIKKYVPIEGTYAAEVSQRNAVMARINAENYAGSMKKNVDRFVKERKSTDDYSTNILELFKILEGDSESKGRFLCY